MSLADRTLRMIMVANIFSNPGDANTSDEVKDPLKMIQALSGPSNAKAGVCGNPVAK